MGRITVYCQPGARETALAGLHDGKPRIRLKARPVDGEANAALVAFVAGRCGVPRASVSIASGLAARIKRVAVIGLDDAALAQALGQTVP